MRLCESGDINCKIISPRVTKREYTFTELHPVTTYKFYITVYSETVTPGPQYEGTLQTLGGGGKFHFRIVAHIMSIKRINF